MPYSEKSQRESPICSDKQIQCSSDHGREWLVSNGGGVFALGCIDRVPRRKYHSLFSLAEGIGAQSSARNMVMDVVETVTGPNGPVALADPRGRTRPDAIFTADPHPKWIYDLGHCSIERQIEALQLKAFPHANLPVMRIRYRVSPGKKTAPCVLDFEPWMLSRSLHAEMKINTSLWGAPLSGPDGAAWRFHLYNDEPVISFQWKGAQPAWHSQGRWENDIHHVWEADRGYTSTEDVFIPGRFTLPWSGERELSFTIEIGWDTPAPVSVAASSSETQEVPVDFAGRLRVAASAYSTGIRESGGITPSIIAGFPWFGPWGRDTMIAIPGYTLATQRSDQAFAILAAMGRRIREALKAGHLGGPHLSHRMHAAVNMHGVDTPFLFVWAIEKLDKYNLLSQAHLGILREIACEIMQAIFRGAFSGVQISADGLVILEKGVWAPTWMDARIEAHAVTPRQGAPIEINALFVNAISYLLEEEDAAARLPEHLRELATSAPDAVAARFWQDSLGYFRDTLDDGAGDFKLRPNQLWLLSLDRIAVDPAQAKSALRAIQSELLTPVGLRTLAPRDVDYRGRCEGDQKTRDLAYHQGTVWPWLLGIYGESLIRFEGVTAARSVLRSTLQKLEFHLRQENCLGQISEIFDGDEPHHARGAPAQAWSVMELFRLLEAIKQ